MRKKTDTDRIADMIFLQTGIVPVFTTDRFQTMASVTIGTFNVNIPRSQIEQLVAIRNTHTGWNVSYILAQIIINEYESSSYR